MTAAVTTTEGVKIRSLRADELPVSSLPPPPVAAPPGPHPSGAPTVGAAPPVSDGGGEPPSLPEPLDPRQLGSRLRNAVEAVVAGQSGTGELAVATLLARGHLLVEDIPGVGKTLLAQALARAVGGSFRRIQGTPDLLPGDVTGSLVPAAGPDGGHHLAFRPGPVFANVVVFDELNRATPRTQSALLEVAEEATVSVDGTTHRLPSPFFLVATQNPIEIAGTYGLGEGALDRFAAVVTPGRAGADAELEVLTGRRGRTMLAGIEPVAEPGDVAAVQEVVARVQVGDAVGRYVVDLLAATRTHPDVRLGASTRAGVSLIALARARAAMSGRSYVVPDDVQRLAVAALGHRVLVHGGDGSTVAGREVVAECVRTVAPPTA